MRADFKRATKILLLLQIGRQEIGNSESSYFYSLVGEKAAGCKIKILRASSASPFYSEARANHRGNDPTRWAEDIRRLGTEISFLKKQSKAQIDERQHEEPLLWRIFIFDNVAYVSAYLYPRDVDSRSIVYKLEEGPDSLYSAFKKYFDYLWLKYDDPHGPLKPNERWVKWE